VLRGCFYSRTARNNLKEESNQTKTFSQSHTNNGLNEHLGGSAWITAYRLNSLSTDEAYTYGSAGTYERALETGIGNVDYVVNVYLCEYVYYVHFINFFVILTWNARHISERVSSLASSASKKVLVVSLLFTMITDQAYIDSTE